MRVPEQNLHPMRRPSRAAAAVTVAATGPADRATVERPVTVGDRPGSGSATAEVTVNIRHTE